MAGVHANNLIKFLKQHEQPSGTKGTHVSAGNTHFTSGNYNIEDRKMLYTLVHLAIKENYTKFSIGEKPDTVGYIPIDIDLHYDPPDEIVSNPKKEKYLKTIIPPEFFKDLACVYKNKIDEIFNVRDIEADRYGIMFFEKAHPTLSNGKIHDGFHGMIEIACTQETQYYLREQVLSEIETLLIKHKIKGRTKQPIDDIVDKRIIKNAWMMYGCAKQNGLPYLLTRGFLFSANDVIPMSTKKISDLTEHVNLTERFSIQGRKCYVDYRSIDVKNDITHFFETKISTKHKIITSKKNEDRKTGTSIDTISKLVRILSCARSNSRDSWLHVGLCLKRLDESLLDDWIEFSKKSDKYKDGECETYWSGFKKEWMNYQIGSLYFWAKQDNEAQFFEIMSETAQGIIMKCVKTGGLTHCDVATILYHYYKDKYVCADPKEKKWYEFRGHIWKEIKIGYTLISKIPDHIGIECEKMALEFLQKSIKTTDDIEIKKYKTYSDEICKYIKSLKNDSYQKSVMNVAAIMFHRESDEFLKKLNKNPYIIACTNGIIDLNAPDEVSAFRNGTPDDFCSISTNQEYIPYDPSSKEITGIKDFLKHVFPRKKVRHHFMKVVSSILYGRNEQEKFYILTGSGGNGKSKIMELIKNALGDYSKPFNIALLQQSRASAAGPNPALHKLRDARHAEAGEPDKFGGFNGGMLKEWSGNDSVSSRTHHQEEEEWIPMFKLFILCNDMPPLDTVDDGMMRRIEVIEFISRFVSKIDDASDPYQFLRNEKLANKFTKWGKHFLSYMVHYYFSYYITEKYDPPNCVIKATKAYEAANDKIKQFMIDYIKPEKGKKIDLKEIYVKFRKWYTMENSGFGQKLPSKEDIEKYLSRKFRKEYIADQKQLKNYSFVEEESDDSDREVPEAAPERSIYAYDSDPDIGIQEDYLSDGGLRGVPKDPIASDSDQDTTFREMVARTATKTKKKQIGANANKIRTNDAMVINASDSSPEEPKKNQICSDIDIPSDASDNCVVPTRKLKSYETSGMTDDSPETISEKGLPIIKKKKEHAMNIAMTDDNDDAAIFSNDSEPEVPQVVNFMERYARMKKQKKERKAQ